jgi:hypothetical protein
MAPRERGLFGLLAMTAVICVFVLVGMTIRDGLGDIAERNQDIRDALALLDVHRQRLAEPREEPVVQIGTTAPSLCTYLDEVKTQVGVSIPSCQEQTGLPKGGFDVLTANIDLREVTVYELADFLEKVETTNRTVVVTNLRIEKSFRDPDKLRKAAMTVTTFKRSAATVPAAGAGGGAAGGEGEEE